MKRYILTLLLTLTTLLFSNQTFKNIKPNFNGIDTTKDINISQIVALGQLGGELTPATSKQNFFNNHEQENKLFASAMQLWNAHEYKKAIKVFKKYLDKYPDGLWAGESVLHLGCEARFNGRYNEANEFFSSIIKKYKNSPHALDKQINDKALSRLAILRLLENNPAKAKELFMTLAKNSKDWRLRTYAQHWLMSLNENSTVANCGHKAMEQIFAKNDKNIKLDFKANKKGQSLDELKKLALKYGLKAKAYKLPLSKLKDISLPAIVQIDRSNRGGAGHYWVIERAQKSSVLLYDSQANRRFTQSLDEFLKEYSGFVLAFDDKKELQKYALNEIEAKKVFGGCCGVQRSEGQLGGDFDKPKCENGGCPVWKVNPANLNLYVYDIPLWYKTPYGLDISFKLSYNSQSAIARNEIFGNKWSFSYGSYVVEDPGHTATVFMPDGKRIVFTNDGNDGFTKSYGQSEKLQRLGDKGYILIKQNGVKYFYDIPKNTSSQQPFLTKISDISGNDITLNYNKQVQLISICDAQGRASKLSYNPQGKVVKVTDPFGRSAKFKYGVDGDLIAITDMAGYKSTLAYDKNKYLTSITKPQGEWKFKIEPADGIPNGSNPYPAPNAPMWEDYRITITNPNGDKSEYFYEGYHGYSWFVNPKDYIEYENGINLNAIKTKFYYNRPNDSLTQLTNTDGTNRYFSYNSKGFMTKFTDENSNSTFYTYNEANQLTSQVKQNRKIEYKYVSDENNLIKSIITQGANDKPLNINYNYNVNKLPIQVSISDGVNTRTIKMQYNDKGQVILIDGAREDIKDITKLSYHDCKEANSCEQLKSITNALGHTTYFDEYQKGRLVGKISEPNGLVTIYRYDDLDRIISIQQFDGNKDLGTTKYEYKAPQQGASKIILPNNTSISYTYNANNQLIQITDEDNNKIIYKRDKNGNIISKEVLDKSGTLVQRSFFEYDIRNRVSKLLDSNNLVKFTNTYDGVSNIISITDALNNTQNMSYNAFNEQVQNINKQNGVSKYTYTKSGLISSVTDPLGLITTYEYNAFGDVIKINSPASGVSFYAYDKAGNQISQTDANNITKNFKYDALNRLSKITFKNSAHETIFDYLDPKKRQTVIEDLSGKSIYSYDALGKLIKQKRLQNDKTYTIKYSYDKLGNITKIIYPSKRVIAYTRNKKGNISKIDTSYFLIHTTLAYDIKYNALNQISSLRYGNSEHLAKTYDLNGKLIKLQHPNITQELSYTKRDNISSILQNGIYEQFVYDALQRLVSAKSDAYGELSYNYDALANLLSEQDNNKTTSYIYNPQKQLLKIQSSKQNKNQTQNIKTIDWSFSLRKYRKHIGESFVFKCPAHGELKPIWGSGIYTDRSSVCTAGVHEGIITQNKGGLVRATVLKPQFSYKSSTKNGIKSLSYYAYWFGSYSLSPVENKELSDISFTYDKAGNTIQKGDLNLTYDENNRLASIESKNLNASYHYDSNNLRAYKIVDGEVTQYFYQNDKLLSYKDSSGWHDIIYLDDEIIAIINNNKIYYNHTDYQGKSIALSDEEAKEVWRANYKPYKESDIIHNGINNPLRFRGQILDYESGFYYNIFREYDPQIKRYTQSDPTPLPRGMGRPKTIRRLPEQEKINENTDNKENNKEETCDEEWDKAREHCRKLLNQPNPSCKRTGGYNDINNCARGLVSEKCGGNKIDWRGKSKQQKEEIWNIFGTNETI